MEFECILCFLELVTLVCGHTPTFRNEATHPLKAPTESTLGLQISDEVSGQTNSNPPKAEPYFSGGKHFEYLLLNDSGVLLTSLQNDNPLDVGAAQQTVSSDKDSFSTKSNFLSRDNGKATPTTKPNQIRLENSINNRQGRTEMGKTILKASESVASKDFSVEASKRNLPSLFQANPSTNANDFRNSFGLSKMADISSTTKLYSKQANKSTENFATFTSPLTAKTVVKMSISEDPLVAAQPPDPPPQPQTKMAQTNTSSQQKQNYDYDDSFTKLLISNGILKPENNKSTEQTTENAVTIRNELHYENAKSGKSSLEIYNRIKDSGVRELMQNGTFQRFMTSSVAQVVEEKTSYPATNESYLPLRITNTHPSSNLTTTFALNELVSGHSLLPPTHSSIYKLGSGSEDLISNSSTTDTKFSNGHTFSSSSTDAVSPSAPILEELTTTITTPDSSNYSSISDAPAITTDTSLSTLTPTEQSFRSVIHLQKRLIKGYETTAQAKTIPSSAEFVHTDQSNENPLSAKAYTEIASDMESETENSPLVNQPFHPQLEMKDYVSTDPYRRDLRILSQLFFSSFSERDVKRFSFIPKSPQLLQPPQALTVDQHILSVSEFKELIEECVRHLFYFVARFIREQNLLSAEMLLENSNSFNRVTLKRFGFLSAASAFNKSVQDLGVYDLSSWRDVADGSYRQINIHLNKLFDDTDNENARWIVFTSADNVTYERLQNGMVSAADYTLAARVSLEYCGLKINAVIALPSDVATNVTLPENEESSIDVNEELAIEEPSMSATNMQLEMSGICYRVLQLFSKYSQAWTNTQASKMRRVDFEYQHEDVEFYIFVLGGAVCIFSILSPMLYGIYRVIHYHRMHSTSSSTPSFRLPSIFRRDKFHYRQSHEKMPESRCESLNVIFSEEFDRKYSSWFDNTHHSSSILKPSADGSTNSGGVYNDDPLDDYPEFSDLTRNVCENNSPRLNKENRLNMSCRPACVLLPHPATYLMQNEKEERYFDNPNYSR